MIDNSLKENNLTRKIQQKCDRVQPVHDLNPKTFSYASPQRKIKLVRYEDPRQTELIPFELISAICGTEQKE